MMDPFILSNPIAAKTKPPSATIPLAIESHSRSAKLANALEAIHNAPAIAIRPIPNVFIPSNALPIPPARPENNPLPSAAATGLPDFPGGARDEVFSSIFLRTLAFSSAFLSDSTSFSSTSNVLAFSAASVLITGFAKPATVFMAVSFLSNACATLLPGIARFLNSSSSTPGFAFLNFSISLLAAS